MESFEAESGVILEEEIVVKGLYELTPTALLYSLAAVFTFDREAPKIVK